MSERVLVYDCFSGISGDMHIGAMLDLGVPEALLREELKRLSMAGEFELEVTKSAKHGITGTLAKVTLKETPGHHRHLQDIERIISEAGYAEAVRTRAIDMFRRIASAEAKVHGTSIHEVHFHEVGATDSIADIVAAAICLEHLAVRDVYVTAVELGGGMVRCAHGLMPVPAPATAELVAGLPCRFGGVDSEATTPTGAAILTHARTRPGMPSAFCTEKVGYGLGQKDFAIPNALRVMLGTCEAQATGPEYLTEDNLEIQCNIDDMPPEAFQPLLEQLFSAGARDVFMTPIIMKKSRPGTRLTVLCEPARKAEMLAIVFQHSSTIGVRVHVVEKLMLPREIVNVDTSLGRVSVKRVRLPHGGERFKLEHDAVAGLARQHGADYLTVYRQLEREVAANLAAIDE